MMPFLAVLGAGRASRFGSAKLDADLCGKPLGAHALHMLDAFAWSGRAVIANHMSGPFADACRALGYGMVHNAAPDSGLARSLGLAVEAAQQAGADALFIALADMPLLPAAHVSALLGAREKAASNSIIATAHPGNRPGVPVILPAASFAEARTLSGDEGARALFRRSDAPPLLLAPDDPMALFDVDTRADLATAHAHLRPLS
jgi:molybdenum cofactor cytidylyltransferase